MHAPGSILSGLVPTEPSRPPLHVAARRARMAGRDVSESHRVSTPLELLFDLAVVVAIAQAAAGLHHGIAEQHIAAGPADVRVGVRRHLVGVDELQLVRVGLRHG